MSVGPSPFHLLFSILSGAIGLIAGALVFAVVVGLVFLLVRFLWFGTRAAQLYLLKNGEPAAFSWPIRPVSTPEPPAPGAAPATDAATPPHPGNAAPVPPHAADPTAAPSPENAAPVPPPATAPRSPRKPKAPPA